MSGKSLCIGDHICLYSEENSGYVYALQSSSAHREVAVYQKQKRENPDVPDPQVISFEACVANRYKLNKQLQELQVKSIANEDHLGLKSQVAQAEIVAQAENEDNETEQKRQRGKKIVYGQIIQLRHVFTKKYIHVRTTQTSRTEISNMQVDLESYNSKHALFKIIPRYIVKAEGDVVQQDDQVVFESVKSQGQYLRVSKVNYDSHSVYHQSRELNLSVGQSVFTMHRRYKPEREHEDFLMSGIPIRLFHKRIEAYLVAEGLDESVQEDVHLRVRAVGRSNPKTLYQPTSAITHWQVEMKDGVLNGNVVKWESQCRIRHMITRMYLKVEGNKVTLTKSHADDGSLFRIHPVSREKDEIEFETYCRIEHVVSGTWLHASSGEFKRKQETSHDDMNMANLQWTKAPLRKITVSEEMQYDDAFTLQKVGEEHVTNFYYMAGLVPFIQKVIRDKKDGQTLDAKPAHEIVLALKELKEFMLVDGEPNKNRQKLLRNLRMVELLVDLLKPAYRATKDKTHMIKIQIECYDVLYTYFRGGSRKNKLYIAKHMEFFASQIATEGEIGFKAAHIVMELMKDNKKIVDRITHSHIDQYVELLNKNKNYRYLDLLSVLCVCDGVAIPDNQKYITEKWLMARERVKTNCVCYTEIRVAIGEDADTVYVSKDNRRSWISLPDFVSTSKETDEEFLFLDHQLDLFGKLCYGRNEFAINVITEKLDYLTWEEAFMCLQDSNLPDQLRAKYCSLIIGLFVDVGENRSVLDAKDLVYLFDEIGTAERTMEDRFEEEARERSITKVYFRKLREWISRFLDNNKDMTASEIGHNILLEQVLRLIHYLVKYGYYRDLKDIKQLLRPMLDLVDGCYDKPCPISAAHGEVNYRKVDRFKQSQETAAIVNAKLQAMEVLDLFFNFMSNTRLERFIEVFKTYKKPHQGAMESHTELAPLLKDEYDLDSNQSASSAAVRTLSHIFEESAYFKNYDLTDILMDLSHYEYDKMVVQSMSLLNRYYSAHNNLFTRAVQSQVLITDRSNDVLTTLTHKLPIMIRLKDTKMTNKQTNTMTEIIDLLIGYCHLENKPEEEHRVNQTILYNHDILNIILDILAQDNCERIAQHNGIPKIFEKSLSLLKSLARNNYMVQQRLFDRLDMLLNIQGAEQQLADCLIEIFTGNKDTCMKILPYQVKKITKLCALHTNKAPQFLEVLDAIVKVDGLNELLKRNQGYVMKYFMQYRSDVAYVLDQPQKKRGALLRSGDSADLEYLLALVDLLATCAQGKNGFIESVCQMMFSIPDLMDILCDGNIDNRLKRPFLRFMLWVYMNTASSVIESGAGDLPHEGDMWKFLSDIEEELNLLALYANSNPEPVKRLLKMSPKRREHGRGDWKLYHGSLHYILEAVMPFLQVFFKSYYRKDVENYTDKADQVDSLASSLRKFANAVGGLMSNQTYMKSMISAMSVMLPDSVVQEFQNQFGGRTSAHDSRSGARMEYDVYYQAEEELNTQLHIFAVNFSVAYGGSNDVKTQIGYSIDKEYTEIGGDEELPLGAEFQAHIGQFVSTDRKRCKDKYKLCGKIIDQLHISGKLTKLSEKERLNQEVLDVKCLQLLRGAIHNEIVKLPDDWEVNARKNKKLLAAVEDVQNSLNEYGGVLRVLDHLGCNSDNIVREVLAFTAAMLFGGNEGVQTSLEKYFLETREDKFFFAIKNRMSLSAMATKANRTIMAQHHAKIEETVEQARALRSRLSLNCSIAANNNGAGLLFPSGNGAALSLRGGMEMQRMNGQPGVMARANTVAPQITIKDMNSQELEEMGIILAEKTIDLEYRDDGYLRLVLKTLGLMCDGQNLILQNYLREQPDNIKSVNLVAQVSRLLALLYGSINTNTIGMVTGLFQTLVEFVSGNDGNQRVVFDNKICDYINHILRRRSFQGCNEKEITRLCQVIAFLITAMIEENPKAEGSVHRKQTQTVSKEVVEALDPECIWAVALDCYQKVMSKSKARPHTAEEDEVTILVGFKYFHVLKRMTDLVGMTYINKNKLLCGNEEKGRVIAERSWLYYEGSTMSVELIKEGELHKIYFRCKDKTVLREDVKGKFKYAVDRSTPRTKLREFVDWSQDIIKDIKYTRRVWISNPISRFFAKYWWHFNMAMIFMSFVFIVLIMVCWKEPNTTDSSGLNSAYKPQYRFEASRVEITTYVLSGIHNLLTLCVLISYFITNHPSLPRFTWIRRKLRKRVDRESKLEVKLISFITIWYLVLFASSALGSAFYGYFFAIHLLHIAMFNQLLKRAIEAVTKNGYSLLWVFLYGMLFIWIYALISFAFYRELYDTTAGLYCTTMYECFITTLHRGLVYTMHEFLNTDGRPFTYHLHKSVFDLSFFIIITTIGLNIIFGIIVDTFSELRDKKWQVDQDMHSACFICSRNSYDFEHQEGGFERHVKKEHNQWAYLFFFIHLDETRRNFYTALELYVSRLLELKNYDFFPLNRALTLQHEVKLETLMSQVTYIVSNMKEQESKKELDME